MHRFDDPIDPRVAADGLVLRVNENDLKIFVRRVLVDPVRVKHTQVGTAASDTLFGGGLQGTLVLELIDTLVRRFS